MKVKKRSNQVCAKRSVVQINKKWPKFSQNHCNTPVTPNEQLDSKIILEDLDALSQRVVCLEGKLSEVTYQFDVQNRVSCCALQDFEKLKCDFENLSCEFKEYKKNNENTDECECGNDEDEIDCVEEIKWLKERMLEFSESLKIQSECLKNVKCTEIPHMKLLLEEKIECLEGALEKLKKQSKEDIDCLKSLNGEDIKELKAQFECLKCQISCITCQLQDLEKQFTENQEMTCDELCSLRLEIMDKIQKTFASNSVRTSRTSAIINTQNLQQVSCEVSKSSSMTKNCCNDDHEDNEWSLKFSDDHEHHEHSNQSMCISITQRLCHIQKQVMSHSVCMQQLVRDLACKVDRREFECHCRKISDTIDTLVQLKRDLEMAGSTANAAGTCGPMSCISCKTSANMTISASNVPKLPPLRYGRENILDKCSRHELSGCSNTSSFQTGQQSISKLNWNCQNFKPGTRKVGGSHTKVNRVMLVNRMRFRRLKTPSCATSRLKCCKSDFKTTSSIF